MHVNLVKYLLVTTNAIHKFTYCSSLESLSSDTLFTYSTDLSQRCWQALKNNSTCFDNKSMTKFPEQKLESRSLLSWSSFWKLRNPWKALLTICRISRWKHLEIPTPASAATRLLAKTEHLHETSLWRLHNFETHLHPPWHFRHTSQARMYLRHKSKSCLGARAEACRKFLFWVENEIWTRLFTLLEFNYSWFEIC